VGVGLEFSVLGCLEGCLCVSVCVYGVYLANGLLL